MLWQCFNIQNSFNTHTSRFLCAIYLSKINFQKYPVFTLPDERIETLGVFLCEGKGRRGLEHHDRSKEQVSKFLHNNFHGKHFLPIKILLKITLIKLPQWTNSPNQIIMLLQCFLNCFSHMHLQHYILYIAILTHDLSFQHLSTATNARAAPPTPHPSVSYYLRQPNRGDIISGYI